MRTTPHLARLLIGLCLAALTGCQAPSPSPVPTVPPTIVPTGVPPAATAASPPTLVPTAAPTAAPPTVTPVPPPTRSPQIAMKPGALPLARTGPYYASKRSYQQTDAARGNRKVEIAVWYPAERPAAGVVVKLDPVDRSGAPYPVLLVGREMAAEWLRVDHFASHGFVVVGVAAWDSGSTWSLERIDFPQDLLFALDLIAAGKLPGLEGAVDVSRAGAVGYSTDGYTALALGGARIDPAFYRARCAAPPKTQPPLPDWWIAMVCGPALSWSTFASRAGESASDGAGLWKAMTDPRIKAVMPMAPEGAWLFGPRGLAAVNKPALIIGGALDDVCLYDQEAATLFAELGSPEKAMITLLGKGHLTGPETEQREALLHFATAFFGFQLQGRSDYKAYISRSFVEQYSDLAWGPVLTQ